MLICSGGYELRSLNKKLHDSTEVMLNGDRNLYIKSLTCVPKVNMRHDLQPEIAVEGLPDGANPVASKMFARFQAGKP